MIFENVVIWKKGNLLRATIEVENSIIKDIITSPYNYLEQDRENFFVTPGFVNAHLHPNKLLSRGLLDDLNIEHLLSKMHVSVKPNDNIRYRQALFILMDAILSGATSIYAVASNPLPVIEAFKYYGLRGAVSCFFNDCWDGYGNKPRQMEYKQIEKQFDALHKHHSKYVNIHVGTASVQSASNDLLRLFDKLAKQYDTKVNLHISEGEESVRTCLKYRGDTPIRLLDKLGVINSKWNLIHVTSIDKEEVHLIANSGANVILCPVSNAKTGVGVAPIRDLIDKNVNIALGTDACSNNNTNNILNEAYTAQLIFNATEKDGSFITHRVLNEWVTINGKSVLGLNDIGEIEIGKRADLLLWSLDNIAFAPIGHGEYYSKLFYNAPDLKPHTVILGGVKAVENYKFLLIDQFELLHHLNNYSMKNSFFDG